MSESYSKIIIVIFAVVVIVGGAYIYLNQSPPIIDEPKRVAIISLDDLEISPNSVLPDEDLEISVVLENTGNGTGSKTVELYIDDSLYDSISKDVEAGESVLVSFDISKSASKEYFVKIEALSDSFIVLVPAEFETSNFSIEPKECGPGDNVTISIVVANIGEVSGDYSVDLKIEGVVEGTNTVTLGAGEQDTVEFVVNREDKRFYLVELDQFSGRFEVLSYSVILEWGGQGGGGGLFNYPTGNAVDDEGFVYVTDTLNNRVQKFTSDGEFVTMWGQDGYDPGEFSSCLDIDVDNEGYVYVAGGNSPYVQKFTTDGVYVNRWNAQYARGIAVGNGRVYVSSFDSISIYTLDGDFIEKWGDLGSGDGEFTQTAGIDVTDEYVYVVENDREGNHRVQKFSLDGTFITKWSITAPSSSWWPMITDIMVDLDGNVYVSNPYESTLSKYDENGKVLKVISNRGNGLNETHNPQGLSVGPTGEIFLSDRGNYRIKKMDTNLNTLDTWGSFGGSGSGYFTMPLDCEIYEENNESYIFINEFWNSRVQKFDLNGNFISLWGSLGSGSGEFNLPEALDVDVNGYVYVSDSGNARIQKFDLNGTYITEWGGRGTGNGQFNRPAGVASDQNGEFVYVVDQGNYRVQKFTSDGTYITKWQTESLETKEYSPRGIDVDSEGFTYVSEQGPHQEESRIQNSSDGDLVQFWYMTVGGSTGTPRLFDVAIDNNAGYVYVLNKRVGELNKYTFSGELISRWSLRGNGLAVDSEGYIYIVNDDENTVTKYKLYD